MVWADWRVWNPETGRPYDYSMNRQDFETSDGGGRKQGFSQSPDSLLDVRIIPKKISDSVSSLVQELTGRAGGGAP
jgi:hypothetical protein